MQKHFLILFLSLLLAGCLGSASPTNPPTVFPTPTQAQTHIPVVTATTVIPPSATPTVSVLPTPTLSNNELNMKLVTQLGGGVNGVALHENLAFLGQGPRLVALDISDLTHIQAKSQSEVLPGLVENVIIQDETAYV